MFKNNWFKISILFIIIFLFFTKFVLANNENLKLNNLTKEEKEWIKETKIIRIVPDNNYAPIEYIKNNEYKGLSSDFIKYIFNNYGLKMEIVESKDWNDALNKVKNKEADLLGGLVYSPERAQYLIFSSPFITLQNNIYMKNEILNMSLSKIKDKKIGVVKGYIVKDYLLIKETKLNIKEYPDVESALKDLNKNEIEVFIGDNAQTEFYINKMNLKEIMNVGSIDLRYDISFGVREDYPLLASILEKGMKSMSDDTKKNIYSKWIPNYLSDKFFTEYGELVLITFATIGFIYIFTSVWIYSLRRKIKESTAQLREINETLEDKVKIRTLELEETQKQLLEIEKDLTSSRLITGIAHALNTPIGNALTAISYVNQELENSSNMIDNHTISRRKLTETYQIIKNGNEIAYNSLQKASNYMEDFKSIVGTVHDVESVVNLSDFINLILNSNLNNYLENDISLKIHCEEYLVSTIQPWAMAQILSNLFLNSLDFGKHLNKTLEISVICFENENNIHLIFKDNGRGMDENIIENIFDAFFTTNLSGKHLGIGLNLVKNLVEKNLNGNIYLREYIDGTTFEIVFPKK